MNEEDLQHLKVLSIFHYIFGGIVFLFSCIPILQFAFGAIIFTIAATSSKGSGEFPPMIFGLVFVIIFGSIVLIGWTCAALIITSGYKLSKYRSHQFCFVIACIECFFMPFGTILGVFTIVVLTRSSVKELFRT